MRSDRSRSGTGTRILMGIARALAAVVLAVVASAALGDLDLHPIEFSRILPVILIGEAVLYVLMLGGGSVAGPILLSTVALTFVLRAGVAVAAGLLSPQITGDLVANAKYYYAAYWPAAAAQVLLLTIMLRLLRPLMAGRKPPATRRGSPRVPPIGDPDETAADEQRRELLMTALDEAPDEPPESPTVLEEQQIGDLGEFAEPPGAQDEEAQDLSLPFDQEAADEAGEEAPLPPGVKDATPADETDATADGPVADEPQPSAEPRNELASEPEPGATSVEDTAQLEPVQPDAAAADPGEMAPPENLEEMVSVLSTAAGGECDCRVWATHGGRAVLAAVPPETPAAGLTSHVEGLVHAHLRLCAWPDTPVVGVTLIATPIGACALCGLGPDESVLVLMAGRGEGAAARLELSLARAAELLQGMAEVAEPPAGPPEDEELQLRPDRSVEEAVEDAAALVEGAMTDEWRAFVAPDGPAVAAAAPPGSDAAELARLAAISAPLVADFTDAIALGPPSWLRIVGERSHLALSWEAVDAGVLLAAAGGDVAPGRLCWELSSIARRLGPEGAASEQ